MAKKATPKPISVVIERKGDFYELSLTNTDFEILHFAAANELSVKTRNGRPMCGFPFHALDGYVHDFVSKVRSNAVAVIDSGVTIIHSSVSFAKYVKHFNADQLDQLNEYLYEEDITDKDELFAKIKSLFPNNQNNNIMETNNTTFNPNFKYFDFTNAYIMLDGEYRQCQMKGYTHYYTDNEADNAVAGDTIYSLTIAGVDGVRKYKHEDLVGKLYHTQDDIINANKMNEREGTVRCNNLNFQNRVLNDARKTYIIRDGHLEFVEVTPDEYKYEGDYKFTASFIHRKSMKEEVTFYKSKDDALAYNKITVRNHDGSSEVIGSRWLDVLPTPEQQEKVDAVLKALDELYASGCRMYVDSDNDTLSFVNGNKALLQSDMDHDEFDVLDGFHLPEIGWSKHHVSCYIGEACGEWSIGLIREKKEENA